jgi:hypothetical protein
VIVLLAVDALTLAAKKIEARSVPAALERRAAPTDDEPGAPAAVRSALPSAPRGQEIRLEAGFLGDLWSLPSGVEPGAYVGAGIRLDGGLYLAVRVRFLGLNSLATPAVVSGTPSLVGGSFEVRLPIVGEERFVLSLAGGVGAGRRSVDEVVAFVSVPSPTMVPSQSESAFEAQARVGLALDTPELGPVRLHLVAGPEVRFPSFTVQQIQYPVVGRPTYRAVFDPGVIAPFLEIGLSANVL